MLDIEEKQNGRYVYKHRGAQGNFVLGVPRDHGVAGVKQSRPVGRWPNQPRFVA